MSQRCTGMRGSRGGVIKYRVSLQFWSGLPEKSQSHQTSIQFWATIGTPAKRRRDNDGPRIVVFGSSHPSSNKYLKKREKQVGPPLTKLSGSAHGIVSQRYTGTTNLLLQINCKIRISREISYEKGSIFEMVSLHKTN